MRIRGRKVRKWVAVTIVVLSFMAVGGVAAGVVWRLYPSQVRSVIERFLQHEQVRYDSSTMKYKRLFNDLQDKQMSAAREVGLKEVPETREDVTTMRKELVKVKNCKTYSLAPMGHSVPYLCPGAKKSLDAIGTAFRDSLKSKALPNYKFVVTSILRTKEDVARLQKTNKLATANSCHCYGTTFDISYARFERVSTAKSLAPEDLKKVLGEVLLDQKKAGNIYVKYEVGQTCFHITSRR